VHHDGVRLGALEEFAIEPEGARVLPLAGEETFEPLGLDAEHHHDISALDGLGDAIKDSYTKLG